MLIFLILEQEVYKRREIHSSSITLSITLIYGKKCEASANNFIYY